MTASWSQPRAARRALPGVGAGLLGELRRRVMRWVTAVVVLPSMLAIAATPWPRPHAVKSRSAQRRPEGARAHPPPRGRGGARRCGGKARCDQVFLVPVSSRHTFSRW